MASGLAHWQQKKRMGGMFNEEQVTLLASVPRWKRAWVRPASLAGKPGGLLVRKWVLDLDKEREELTEGEKDAAIQMVKTTTADAAADKEVVVGGRAAQLIAEAAVVASSEGGRSEASSPGSATPQLDADSPMDQSGVDALLALAQPPSSNQGGPAGVDVEMRPFGGEAGGLEGVSTGQQGQA